MFEVFQHLLAPLTSISSGGILFALHLTVAEGSINGLTNVLGMNHAVLFSRTVSGYSYLHMFLAWLNLELGISMCLFDGLDGYTET